MRTILLFLLISLIITQTDIANDARMLQQKAETGISAISEFVPEGKIIAGLLTPFFVMFMTDLNTPILEKFEVLKNETTSRLDRIEN